MAGLHVVAVVGMSRQRWYGYVLRKIEEIRKVDVSGKLIVGT